MQIQNIYSYYSNAQNSKICFNGKKCKILSKLFNIKQTEINPYSDLTIEQLKSMRFSKWSAMSSLQRLVDKKSDVVTYWTKESIEMYKEEIRKIDAELSKRGTKW